MNHHNSNNHSSSVFFTQHKETQLWPILALLIASPALAQRIPDAGSMLRDIERATGKSAIAPAPLAPIGPSATGVPLPEYAGAKVFVSGFRIEAKRFPEAELQDLLRDYTGREVTLAELQEAARKIGEYYRQHDYMAHAYLPPQTIQNGVVYINVVEGSLGQIKLDPSTATRLNADVAIGMVSHRIPPGEALRPGQLDEAIAVLNELVGIQRAASLLEAGAKEGQSDVVLRIEDGPMATGGLTFDNTGSKGTGNWQAAITGALNNPYGRGEQFQFNGLKSSGSSYARLGGALPLGPSGLRAELNASLMHYQVSDSVSPLDMNGDSWTSGFSLDYPLRRSAELSLTASTSFDYKRMTDSMGNTDIGDKEIAVGHASLSAMTHDNAFGGPGTNHFSVTATFGNLDILDRAQYEADQLTARSDGGYSKLQLSLSREQPITERVTLSVGVQGQMASGNLDSSEKFTLGGLYGVRAYPTGEASGDSGWLANLEAKWQVQETVQLSGFYDIGSIHQHSDTWTNWQAVPDQPNSYHLQGIGLGVQWTPSAAFQARAAAAYVIGDNPGHDLEGHHSDGTDDDFRAWLQVAINF